MTGWIIAACIAAYVAVGLLWYAPQWVTREVEQRIRRWPSLADDPATIARWRREAAGFSILLALVWPIAFAARALITLIVGASPPTTHELKVSNEQQAKRIAELESELGIGRSS